MRKVEFVRNIIGIAIGALSIGIITYRGLNIPREENEVVAEFTYTVHEVEGEDIEVSEEEKALVTTEKKVTFRGKEYIGTLYRDGSKARNYANAIASYYCNTGESFSIDLKTGEVVIFVYECPSTDDVKYIPNVEREEIAKKYASELIDVDDYTMKYEEKHGFHNYTFTKYVDSFATRDYVTIDLLGDGTLFIFCYYNLDKFDELDKMYEYDENGERGPVLSQEKIEEVVLKKVKEKYGDNVAYREMESFIVERRNGEFAILVVGNVYDENNKLVEVGQDYYVTWE